VLIYVLGLQLILCVRLYSVFSVTACWVIL